MTMRVPYCSCNGTGHGDAEDFLRLAFRLDQRRGHDRNAGLGARVAAGEADLLGVGDPAPCCRTSPTANRSASACRRRPAAAAARGLCGGRLLRAGACCAGRCGAGAAGFAAAAAGFGAGSLLALRLRGCGGVGCGCCASARRRRQRADGQRRHGREQHPARRSTRSERDPISHCSQSLCWPPLRRLKSATPVAGCLDAKCGSTVTATPGLIAEIVARIKCYVGRAIGSGAALRNSAYVRLDRVRSARTAELS